MRILVCGSSGKMGKRYMKILGKIGGVVPLEYDLPEQPLHKFDFDRAIIATPTNTHYQLCMDIANMGKDFLCEKPVCFEPKFIRDIIKLCETKGVDGRMVSNWCYARELLDTPGRYTVSYNYHKTGDDGLYWDCIQLIYLAKEFYVDDSSHLFTAIIDGWAISQEDIERSYEIMVRCWIGNNGLEAWTMRQALEATEKVRKLLKRATSKEDIPGRQRLIEAQ